MYRHLKNINELIFYASLSCVGSFIARQYPGFWVPILLVRLGVFAYCMWLLVFAEQQKIVAGLISTSLVIGAVGGYWDYLEILFKFDNERITKTVTISLLGLLALSGIGIQIYVTTKPSQK